MKYPVQHERVRGPWEDNPLLPRAWRRLTVETRLVRPRGWKPGQAPVIVSPADAATFVHAELLDREIVVVIVLDNKNQVVAAEVSTVSSMSESMIHPAQVLRTVLLAGGSRFILVHNHPAGIPKPSTQDADVTARMMQAGDIMGTPMLDHIIVGHGELFSFSEHGLIR